MKRIKTFFYKLKNKIFSSEEKHIETINLTEESNVDFQYNNINIPEDISRTTDEYVDWVNKKKDE